MSVTRDKNKIDGHFDIFIIRDSRANFNGSGLMPAQPQENKAENYGSR